MLPSPERLHLAMPLFFRKVLVDLPPSDPALLEVVDDCWKLGRTPDLQMLLDSVATNDPHGVIPDLIMMDMEWRWRIGSPDLFRDLRDYEAMLRHPLPIRDRARILCREFGIRNRWGDCISRQQICCRHPELTDLFIKHVRHEISDIAEWPEICLLQRGAIIASASFDRPVTAGRQSSSAQKPWSINSFDFCHHIVLCELQSPMLSRQQLEFCFLPSRLIAIRNTSRSRAIAIRSNKVVIDAGQSYQCTLDHPIRVHLMEEYEILLKR